MPNNTGERHTRYAEAATNAAIREVVQRLMYDMRKARNELETLLTSDDFAAANTTRNLAADLLDDLLDAVNTADNLDRNLRNRLQA